MAMSQRSAQIVSIVWRAMKVMPIIGYAFVLAGAPVVLKRKGLAMGLLVILLDVLPLICLIKAAIEVYYGDIIPDRSGPERFDVVTDGGLTAPV
ncbi:MAG: hypothetical protein EBZ36_03320 [Acidobacteria bacterium]|nr:hypothetical protein [Acidobacteriota bacterium]